MTVRSVHRRPLLDWTGGSVAPFILLLTVSGCEHNSASPTENLRLLTGTELASTIEGKLVVARQAAGAITVTSPSPREYFMPDGRYVATGRGTYSGRYRVFHDQVCTDDDAPHRRCFRVFIDDPAAHYVREFVTGTSPGLQPITISPLPRDAEEN